MKEIFFTDAQKMHKENPDTFFAPSIEELSEIQIKDSVKVCVNNRERFWVTVEKIDENNIIGVVDNNLVEINLKLGEEIRFEKRHIYDIF